VNFLTRLRGLQAPVALDEPLRLQDGFSGIITPGGGTSHSSGGGRSGEDGERGRSIRGRRGVNGAVGATGASGGEPPGAYWVTLGGGAVTLPLNSVKKVMNATGTFKRVIVYTDGGPGSCAIKIWKANITSHYPPVVTDDITGGANVVISSASTYDDSTLAGWTTSFVAGDIILFTLSATTNFTTVGISLLI
jgi:hypothetical protein